GGIALCEGRLYITLTNRHTIECYDDSAKSFVTIAGVRDFEGHADGKGVGALFNEPMGIASASDGSLFVADMKNNAVRRLTSEGDVTTVCGFSAGRRDGSAGEATLFQPFSIAVSPDGQIAVGELGSGRIAVVTKTVPKINEETYPQTEIVPPAEDAEVKQYTEAIKNAPLGYRLYVSYCERGARLAQLKQFDAALEDIKKAATIIPFSMRAYITEGDVQMMKEKVDEAIKAYTKAIEMKEKLPVAERCSDPFYIKAYYLRALAYLRQGENESALKDVEQALSYRSHTVSVLRYPDVSPQLLAEMLTLKGNILLNKGKLEEAEKVLSDAIRRMRGLKEA
ncbi:MAG: tetratricopeptide repeat protein, partial [Planctomycetota bacterium]|nr:tetratricopeptide repeat protein [Planctomycetota bacterium]